MDTKYQLIASPYPDGHLVVSPGQDGGIKIGANRYAELRDATPAAPVPDWLTAAARAAWDLDVTGQATANTVMVRPETEYGYARASYELNLGCNYDCEHCYLGEKAFAGMDWPGRERLLNVMAQAGVLWLQLTGGEPMIDPLFAEGNAQPAPKSGTRQARPQTPVIGVRPQSGTPDRKTGH